MIKDENALSYIRKNCRDTIGAFVEVQQILRESVIVNDVLQYNGEVLTSEYVHTHLKAYLAQHKLVCPEGLIVSCGADAASPHHEGAGPIVAYSTIVVDVYPQSRSNTYWADVTRTYVKGEPTDMQQSMYDAVIAARDASLAALRPGVKANELYLISATTITDAGFLINEWKPGAVGYIHSLGHGLGQSVHEAPTLGRRDSTVLESGMVVTIEPGLYDPAHGGVRIEDTVVITDDGYEILTPHPIQFVIE